MSKSVRLTFCAVIGYALQANILEQKLAKLNPAVTLTLVYLVMLPLALVRVGHMRLAGERIVLPSGTLLWLALTAGLVWYIADFLYIKAFTVGGDLLTITMVMTLYPVVASAMKQLWARGLPNRYQVIAYCFVAAAVYFAGKGNTAPPAP